MGYCVCACCALRDAGQLPLPNPSGAGQILVGGFVGRFHQTNKRPKKPNPSSFLEIYNAACSIIKLTFRYASAAASVSWPGGPK